MKSYATDNTIKLEYNPVINKQAFPVNQVGAAGLIDIEEADFAYSDSNAIHVSDTTGNDSTGSGTSASPYKTIKKGITSTTAAKGYVIILDSATYYEDDLAGATYTYVVGLYAAIGQTPHRSCRELDYTPSDSNTIYVSKAGSDSNTGTAASPLLTIAHAITHCDGTHQHVMIADDGTYTEDGFTFSGNFLYLYAAAGKCPTVSLTRNDSYATFEVSQAETVFKSGAISYVRCVALTDDRVLISYASSHVVYYMVLDSLYATIKAETSIDASSYDSNSVIQLDNGKILFLYKRYTGSTYYLAYKVLNGSTFAEEVAMTYLVSKNTHVLAASKLPDGNVFVAYVDASDSSKGKFIVISGSDYTTLVDEIEFESDALSSTNISCCTRTNGNTVIVLGEYYWEYTSSGSHVASGSVPSGYSTPGGCCITADDDVMVLYNNGSGYGVLYVMDALYTMLTPDIAFHSATTSYSHACYFNNQFFIVYQDSADSSYGKFIAGMPHVYHIGASAAAVINGITLNAAENAFLQHFINASAAFQARYCTIENCVSDNNEVMAEAISSNADVKFYNSICRDNDAGIYTQENTSTIQDSQFYRITRGYAIDIDGAAASSGDITIEHCDIYDNYGSIHLENNNGTNEILKNLILYNNALGIDAETAVTVSNSVITDEHVNATDGTSVISANPLYLNEGFFDEDAIDLNLKYADLGYHATSPAYDLADDDRNAGAYDVKYIGSVPTWTSITLDKPDIIDVTTETVAASNTKDDGSVSSRKRGRTESVKLKWSAITVADWDKLDTMLESDDSEIRLYPDPTTYPNEYDTYVIEYSDLKCSPKYWRLSDRGNQDVAINLARKYERP